MRNSGDARDMAELAPSPFAKRRRKSTMRLGRCFGCPLGSLEIDDYDSGYLENGLKSSTQH